MTHNDKKKIDRLLLNYYQEEARRLYIPESQRCWQDFQKLLEKNGPDKTDTDISTIPEDAVSLKGRIFHFTGRYRNIAAAAAACFLVIMLLSGMPPMQMLRQVLTGTLPETEMVVPEDKAAEEYVMLIQPPEPMPPPSPPSVTDPGDTGPGDTEVFADKADEQFSILQGDGADLAPPANESSRQGAVSPAAGDEMGGLMPPATAAEEVRELIFNTLHAYRTALHEYANLVPGKLFYLAAPPAGYTFSRAAIYKTGTLLTGVRQEFTEATGDKLILQQQFAAPIIKMMPPETARATAPRQPSPENREEAAVHNSIAGTTYTVSMENGRITLHYSLDNSVLMLTAALDEEMLRQISAQLAAFER